MNEEFSAKPTPVDELAMPTIDLNPSPVAAQTEDWGMTNPLKKPSNGMKIDGDGWTMPDPVFRVSDGFCPLDSNGKTKSTEKTPKSSALPDQAVPADEPPLANLYAPPEDDVSQQTMHNISLSDLKLPVSELAPVTPKIIAAPQPNISQEYTVNPPQKTLPKKEPRSEKARLFLAALGILAMLAFAAGFLALVYFLFFYKVAE